MAASATLTNFNPITLEDILGGNKQDLFNQFGMSSSGNNEVGAQMRRIVQAIFPLIAQRLVEMGKIQPAVNQSIEQTAHALSPEGVMSTANENRANLERQGAQRGDEQAAQLRSAGLSPAASEGAKLAAENQSTGAANAFQNNLMSPEAMLNRSAQLSGFQSGLSTDMLNQLLSAGGFIEQRHQANQAERNAGGLGGFGSVLGSLGNIAGMTSGIPWRSILQGLGGHSGGGGFNSSTMSDYGLPGDQVGPYGFIPR